MFLPLNYKKLHVREGRTFRRSVKDCGSSLVPAHGLGSGDVASSRDVLGARYVREMQFQGIVGLHGRVRLSFIRPQNPIRGDTGQNQLVLGS